ncbi:hypothetical protein O181_122119 [Austropuccinia psidii MF-1]|uniref:Uncharacterized protein n=1 Tax=Austropuccinia psidii MF-1 TaxID=1389203 RepID=A0A9Q3KJX8_9BASI|nr:hypothetical protein [Austropuccinia psidii MF-1]
MLTCLHPPPDETPTLPPISALTTPYTSAPPPHLLLGLQSLRCHGAFKLCLQRCPHPPNMPPTLLTIFTLTVPSQHASNAPYHPYACRVPSHHASNTAYHPYTCIVPAQHSSDAAYHP